MQIFKMRQIDWIIAIIVAFNIDGNTSGDKE